MAITYSSIFHKAAARAAEAAGIGPAVRRAGGSLSLTHLGWNQTIQIYGSFCGISLENNNGIVWVEKI